VTPEKVAEIARLLAVAIPEAVEVRRRAGLLGWTVAPASAPVPEAAPSPGRTRPLRNARPKWERPPPVLIDAEEAAALLGITENALRLRVQRHLVPGVVRTGRRVQFHRERLLAGIERKVRP
jgi:hypothetical protein